MARQWPPRPARPENHRRRMMVRGDSRYCAVLGRDSLHVTHIRRLSILCVFAMWGCERGSPPTRRPAEPSAAPRGLPFSPLDTRERFRHEPPLPSAETDIDSRDLTRLEGTNVVVFDAMEPFPKSDVIDPQQHPVASIRVCVDRSGSVRSTEPADDSGEQYFDALAQAHVRRWRFVPYAPAGTPVEICAVFVLVGVPRHEKS